MASWPLQRDPFRAPDETETPPPVLLDAWEDIVVYTSGRRIRILRLGDGYDAIVLQGPFLEEGGFPFLDAAMDKTGFFYAASALPWSDPTPPYGRARVMFVPHEALEALPAVVADVPSDVDSEVGTLDVTSGGKNPGNDLV